MTNPPQRNRLRFTLRGLFAVVTVAAIGCAALANPTDLWASVVLSGTLGLLIIALLVAVARRGAARVGANGFALCGCAYLGLILAPGAGTNIVPNLVTSKVLVEAESKWPPAVSLDKLIAAISRRVQPGSLKPIWISTASYTDRQTSPFQRIGHSLFALLFAIVGSVVTRWLWAGEARTDDRH